jgi:hypothetical protein
MGSNTSKTKYVILFGDKGSGKTLLQYQLQSSIKLEHEQIRSTYGFNYEEYSIKDRPLGIFDVSGDLKQYGIVDIITKCVEISGVIFMVGMDKLDELDKAKEHLKIILGNNFLNDNISLMVLYNKKDVQDKLDWMEKTLLDSRMGIDKLVKKFKLKYFQSKIIDVNYGPISELNDELEKFVEELEKDLKSGKP